jgi:hypothetical protein
MMQRFVAFPPPHQFQFRDYSTNLGLSGTARATKASRSGGFRIRQNKDDGGNFVPQWRSRRQASPRHVSARHARQSRGGSQGDVYTHRDRFQNCPAT